MPIFSEEEKSMIRQFLYLLDIEVKEQIMTAKEHEAFFKLIRILERWAK